MRGARRTFQEGLPPIRGRWQAVNVWRRHSRYRRGQVRSPAGSELEFGVSVGRRRCIVIAGVEGENAQRWL
jgi:hypothetical protein